MVGEVSYKMYEIYLNYAGGFKIIFISLLLFTYRVAVRYGADICLKY